MNYRGLRSRLGPRTSGCLVHRSGSTTTEHASREVRLFTSVHAVDRRCACCYIARPDSFEAGAPRCFGTNGSSLTIELLDRREDVASFANSHRVCARRNPLPSQRERLNILCDVQVNGHFRRPFPASGPQGNRQRARMFGQTQHSPSAGIGSDR